MGYMFYRTLGLPRSAIVAAVAATLLAGCAKGTRDTRLDELDSNSRRAVEDSLAASAARAAKAQETLAQIERARTEPAPASLDVSGLPPELRRPATMNWSGPAPEAARQVAGLVGYEFRIVGNAPPNLPMVSVAATDLPVAKVVEDIGLQVQGIAQVLVDPNVKRIEFRYLAAYPAGRTSRRIQSAPSITK